MWFVEIGGHMAEPRDTQERGFKRRPRILDYLGAGNMEESEARDLACQLTRRARQESSRHVEGSAPDPDEVRERRESRQRSHNA